MFSVNKEGVLNMYADPEKTPINSSASKDKAAGISDFQNTTKYLQKVFFTPNPTILNNEKMQSGGQVTLMVPSGPYSEEAVMVIAAGPRSFDTEEAATETIYDYPKDTQKSYWAHIVSSLQSFTNTIPQGNEKDYAVFATENCVITRTSKEHRTSRSIALPHAQILRIHMDHIEPLPEDVKPIEHLVFEQRVLKRYGALATYVNEVASEVYTRTGQDLMNVELQQVQPFGYSFTPSETNDIDEIVKVMDSHQSAYKHIADRWVGRLHEKNQKRLIPQPSYRMYMYLEDETFRVTVAPEFLSYAGVIEATGIRLSRDSMHPQRIHHDQKKQVHRYIVNNLPSFGEIQEVAAAD